jgi:transcriptional regulator with GAF, ATPase, and Fis domain
MDTAPAAAILGRSPATRRLRRELVRAARTPATVLLQGETGTGKGLAARAIHALSAARRRPFVHVDCAALSPGLVESELFGHERGAFTGAHRDRPGRLERVSGGTLFLDEVGELAPALQAKWLRALQDREFERVGGLRTLPLEARVVAATHRSLRRDVERGRFRADLYFRLAVVRVRLPPLRERPGDATLLARRWLPLVARRFGSEPVRPAPGFFRALERHPWPGNVRELHNALEAVSVRFAGRPVGADALGAVIDPADGDVDLERACRVVEQCEGNVARAARELGVPRTTLRDRLRRAAPPVVKAG